MDRLAAVTDEMMADVNEWNKFILDDFLTNSVELSPKTLHVYLSNLRIWFVWVKDNLGNKQQTEIKPLDFKRYQNWLVQRGASSSDVSNKRAAVSSLNNYIEIYYSDEFPTFRNFINKSIKRPPANHVREKAPLTKAEFAHVIEVLTADERWQVVAYLQFTFATGCRREESRQLTKDVVDMPPIIRTVTDKETKKEVEVRSYHTKPIRCKGAGEAGKVRKLEFDETAMQAIKKWLEVRGEDDCPYVFVSRKNDGTVEQISAASFNLWMEKYVDPIVGRHIWPHMIRASRASQAVVEDGIDIHSVQKLLGHESSQTTEVYVIRDADEETGDMFLCR